MSHLATNSAMSLFIPRHQYLLLKSINVFVAPGWMEYVELCAPSMITWRKSPFFGTQMRSLYHSVSFSSTRNPGAFPLPVFLFMVLRYRSSFWACLICSSSVGCTFSIFAVPWLTICRFKCFGSLASSVGSNRRLKALQWALWLNASATTFAFPG